MPGVMDLIWPGGGGGGERNEAEDRALLHRAGFELTRVVPTGGSHAVLEGRPFDPSARVS